MLLISAPTVISGLTSRPTFVLIWSTTGRTFSFLNDSSELLFEGKAALVAPNTQRQLQTIDSNIYSLNIEPGHPLFFALSNLNFHQGLIPLDPQLFIKFSSELNASFQAKDYARIDQTAKKLIRSLLPYSIQQPKRDKRIDELLPLLDCSTPLELESLAKLSNLSKDRLSHLFTEKIGMPLRSYILWRRYRRALLALQSGQNIATTAHQVGFYDHSQMSKTFSSLFGYTPSTLKQPEFIRISKNLKT